MVSDNKRIALNTAVLYVKLILSVFIGLYTSRVVLQALGASDYGLYTVVGGIVTMMNFLGTTMVSVSYRYIVVEFGKKEQGDPNKVFNTVMVIHIVLMFLLLFVGELFGTYYINNIAKFDPAKIDDAIFVLHMSLIATALNIISIPYNGLIIAREKFVYTAIVEIGRSLLKLVLVIFLLHYLGNKLRLYSVIAAFYSAILPISLFVYSFIKEKSTIKWRINKKLSDYKEICKYAFWIMFGALACMGQNQGSNMIINYFFNTVINAAFAIGFQINSYVMMFVQSLNQAAVPQIMKGQSSGDTERSLSLVYTISKCSFFIMLIPVVPLSINIDYILSIWLKDVPPFTNIFAILLMICGLIRCLGAGFDSSIQATGKIKPFQIFYSIAYIMVLPISFLLYTLHSPVYIILICTIISAICILIFQIIYLSKITKFDPYFYLKNTVLKCFYVTLLSLPLLGFSFINCNSLLVFFISSSISLICLLINIYYFGCNKKEKIIIKKVIKIFKNEKL